MFCHKLINVGHIHFNLVYGERFLKHICLVVCKPVLLHYTPNIVYLGGDSLECSWIGFLEKESEVSYYTFDVGTTEGDDSVYASAHLEAGTRVHRATGKYFDNVLFMYVAYISVICISYLKLIARHQSCLHWQFILTFTFKITICASKSWKEVFKYVKSVSRYKKLRCKCPAPANR